jgi:hypothetical protein
MDPLVIYAGAGVTIDRTGIGWDGLIRGLLRPHISDAALREQLVEVQGPQQAASMAAQLYIDMHGDQDDQPLSRRPPLDPPASRLRMIDELRPLLYAGREWGGGLLGANIAGLVMLKRDLGHRCCIVTPNYDDFLVAELRQAAASMRAPGSVQRDVHHEPQERPVRAERLRWKDGPWKPLPDLFGEQDGSAVCHLLHGYVPQEGEPYAPVVSEQDYLHSGKRTEAVLKKLFGMSNVVITGASLTDPPLLRALLATRRAGMRRYGLLPLQDQRWNTEKGGSLLSAQRYLRARTDHFGVVAIHPEFYVEVAQFFKELMVVLAAPQDSYAARVNSWWARWRARNADDLRGSRQKKHHNVLENALADVNQLLGVSADEKLKVDLWVLWEPSAERKLKLWASSLALAKDVTLMREELIDLTNRHPIVETFRNGRTMCKSGPEGARWRSYLSAPVWLWNEGIPAGVVALASMREQDDSILSDRNRSQLMGALNVLTGVARNILQDR